MQRPGDRKQTETSKDLKPVWLERGGHGASQDQRGRQGRITEGFEGQCKEFNYMLSRV